MSSQRKRCGVPFVLTPLFVVVCLGPAGCAGGDRPASVSGKVTYNGKPVTSGIVVLVGKDGKTSDLGHVKEDGTYSIAKSPSGPVKVSFDNPAPPPVPKAQPGAKNAGADAEAQDAADEAKKYVPTPPKYKDPEKSGLTFDLKAGKNENCDINLQ